MDFSRSLILKLLALTLSLILLPSFALSWYALIAFERDLRPEIDRKSQVVGRAISTQLARAIDYGIPLERLVGVDEFLRDVLHDTRGISYLAVTDRDGRLIYQVGLPQGLARELDSPLDLKSASPMGDFFDTALPMQIGPDRFGAVHVGVEQAFVQKQLREIFYDILTALLVSFLVTFELLLFLVALNVSNPIRLIQTIVQRAEQGDFTQFVGTRSGDEIGKLAAAFNETVRRLNNLYARLQAQVNEIRTEHYDQRIGERIDAVFAEVRGRLRFAGHTGLSRMSQGSVVDIRTPLFIFVFAEEMSRSFFPVFVRELHQPIPYLTQAMAIGLPIAVFMFFVAVVTPFSGSLVDRIGAKRVFLIGLLPALVGFVMTGMAQSIPDLLIWRSLTAIGYAMVTIAAQGYIVDHTSPSARAQGMSVFVGAVIAAGICGNAIGGIMADRIGFRATFYFSAGLTVVAGLLVYHFLSVANERRRAEGRKLRLSDFKVMFGNARFVALLLFAAIPAKVILTAFLFYLVPLYLVEQGSSQSEVGRIMMSYGIALVIVSPIAAYLSDRFASRAGFIAAGCILSGLGVLGLWFWPSPWMVLSGVALLGLSHAVSASTQLAILPEICQREIVEIGQTTVFSMLRLLERAGSVAGPFLAALFVERYGYVGASLALGMFALGTAFVFSAIFALWREDAGLTSREARA